MHHLAHCAPLLECTLPCKILSFVVTNSMLAIANCNSELKSVSDVTGRCALFNVKLHFYEKRQSLSFVFCWSMTSVPNSAIGWIRGVKSEPHC